MTNNAGIHTRDGHWRSQVQTGKRSYVDYSQLFLDGPTPSLTIVGEVTLLKWAFEASERIFKACGKRPIIVARVMSLEGSVKTDWGKAPIDAKKRGELWATDLYGQITNFLQSHPELKEFAKTVYWQPKDETKDDWEWQVDFEVAAMDRLCGLGYSYAGVNLFTGAGKIPPIDHVNEIAILLPIIRAIKKWGIKAIGQLHVYIESDQPLDWDHQKYHALRPQAIFRYLREQNLAIPWVFGESGTYNEWKLSGVTDYKKHADMMVWMFDQYQGFPELRAINLYDNCTLEGSDGEEKWYVPPETAKAMRLYNDLHANDPEVETPPPPVPQPEPDPVPPPTENVTVRVTSEIGVNLRVRPIKLGETNLIVTIPHGTVLTITGPTKNHYAPVIVEIVVGTYETAITGWVYDNGGLTRLPKE